VIQRHNVALGKKKMEKLNSTQISQAISKYSFQSNERAELLKQKLQLLVQEEEIVSNKRKVLDQMERQLDERQKIHDLISNAPLSALLDAKLAVQMRDIFSVQEIAQLFANLFSDQTYEERKHVKKHLLPNELELYNEAIRKQIRDEPKKFLDDDKNIKALHKLFREDEIYDLYFPIVVQLSAKQAAAVMKLLVKNTDLSEKFHDAVVNSASEMMKTTTTTQTKTTTSTMATKDDTSAAVVSTN
jgi:hypothetical protein